MEIENIFAWWISFTRKDLPWCVLNSKLEVWMKIKFENEKQKYTVQASNIMFAILSKPFNAQKTVLYTIIDFWKWERWPENLVFWMWAETKEQCEEMLERLTQQETELSYRHNKKLDIEEVHFVDWTVWK